RRNLGHAERRSVRSQDGRGPADLVEEGENLDFRFHLLGHGFDYQVGFARGLLHRGRVFQAANGFVSGVLAHLPEFDGFVEVGANFRLRPAQRGWKNVLQDSRYPPSAAAYAMPRPMMPAPITAMVRTSA